MTGRTRALILLDRCSDDNALLLAAFRAKYPDIKIVLIAGGVWQASIAGQDGETFITRYEVPALLDKLAGLGYALDGPDGARPGSSHG